MTTDINNCSNCNEIKNPIFDVLTTRQKETLFKHQKCVLFIKGQTIYEEGETPESLICLSTGKVKIFKTGVGGREQIIRLVKAGDFIGFRALFAEDKYIASAVAIEDCQVCIVEKKFLFELMSSNNELSMAFIKKLAYELGISNLRTISLTQKHIRGRLAESLLVLIEIYGYEEDNQTIKVKLSREDIANLSNMTTSNAIRTLSAFANEGVVELVGKKIKILLLEQLEKISNLG